MSAGFQARLDEMLRSREAQLQRLNEETALQGGKRSIVEERKAQLRRTQRRVMALKLGLDKVELHTALVQEELRHLHAKEEELVQEHRGVALETFHLRSHKSIQGETCICESLEELRQNASKLELVLKGLDRDVKEATAREEYLAGFKGEVEAQVRDNEQIKRGMEERMVAMRQLQEEMDALQLDNQMLEKQLLAALQE